MKGVLSAAFAMAMALAIAFATQAAAQAEDAPPPPAPRPYTPPPAEVQGAEQRARFEAQLQAMRERSNLHSEGGDYSGFADAAEAEAMLRREQALARGAQLQAAGARDALDDEMFQTALNEGGLFGKSGCFVQKPAFTPRDDFAPYKQLQRADFREQRASVFARGGDGETGTRAFITLGCTLEADVQRRRADWFAAVPRRAEFFALLSRARSFWAAQGPAEAARALAQEQRRFNSARQLAEKMNAQFAQGEIELRGEGSTEAAAVAELQRRWLAHMQSARDKIAK